MRSLTRTLSAWSNPYSCFLRICLHGLLIKSGRHLMTSKLEFWSEQLRELGKTMQKTPNYLPSFQDTMRHSTAQKPEKSSKTLLDALATLDHSSPINKPLPLTDISYLIPRPQSSAFVVQLNVELWSVMMSMCFSMTNQDHHDKARH